MKPSPIFKFIRLGVLLGLAVLIAVSATARKPVGPSTGSRPDTVTPAQLQLKTMFPNSYAKAAAEFGWRQHRDGQSQGLPDKLPKRVVVLVHGLDEPGKLWMNVAPAVTNAGYATCEFRYPNDQPLTASATYLLHSLGDLRTRGTTEIIFVSHSMGGLVCRELLTSPELDHAGGVIKKQVPAVKRLLMLCPPNHGSPLAHARFATELRDQCMRLFKGNGNLLSGLVDGTGEAGTDLVPDSEFLRTLNGRPSLRGVTLTIIAGIASPITTDQLGVLDPPPAPAPEVAAKDDMAAQCRAALESLAEGVGDGCVSVDSAKLTGVTDFVTVQGTHLSTVRNVLESSTDIPPAVPLVLERLAKDWPLPPRTVAK